MNCTEEGIDICIATVLHRDNLVELNKILNLTKELGTRFIHFNYIPTCRAKRHVKLDLTPDERLYVLETIGEEMINIYLQAKEEELKYGKSNLKIGRFFSTCPQYSSVIRDLSERYGRKFMVEAHYSANEGIENFSNFLGGCGAGCLYCCLEPNGEIRPCVFFQTKKETILGNILKNNFKKIWDCHPFLWKLGKREVLEDYTVNGKRVGCENCPDKFVCGGCRARAYSYFNGNIKAPDIGCINNKRLWAKILEK